MWIRTRVRAPAFALNLVSDEFSENGQEAVQKRKGTELAETKHFSVLPTIRSLQRILLQRIQTVFSVGKIEILFTIFQNSDTAL